MQRSLDTLASQVFDVAVVGGGITGGCIARDAARRGMRVALLEAHDFSSGTSAATSKMVHGGLRYLQTLELRVVRESLRERRAWLRIAPHLVHPLRFLVPAHSRAQDWQVRTGVALYDLLSARGGNAPTALRRGHHLTAAQLLARAPVLAHAHLRGGMSYGDCHSYAPERVALECVMDAHTHGAAVANYVEVTGLTSGTPQVLAVRDCLTSAIFTVSARLVVNAAGPWADTVSTRLGLADAPRLLRSKGIHLVTRAIAPPDVALTVPVQGRHFFVIPWRDRSLIGTTDTPYTGSPDDVGVSEDEIADFLGTINAGLPAAALTRDDVTWAYAGLRPLVASRATSTYTASRRAEVRLDAPRMLSVIGGKWTTARAVAEQCVDRLAELHGQTLRPCDTGTSPLPGATVEPDAVRDAALPAPAATEARRLLGGRASRVFALAASDPTQRELLGANTLAASIALAIDEEMAMTLGDVLFRRTGLGVLGALPPGTLERAAAFMGARLGWSNAEQARQVQDIHAQCARVSMTVPP